MKGLIKFIVGLAVVFAIVVGIVFVVTNTSENAEFYKVGSDQIPSVKKVLGTRKVQGVSAANENGKITKSYDCISDNAAEDIENYLEYLMENEGFTLEDSGKAQKESADEGRLLTVSMESTDGGFKITIQKDEIKQ